VFAVGAERMTRSQFDRFVANLPENVRKEIQTPEGKRKLANQLVEVKALAQEARKRGIAERAEVKQQVALQVENVLASTLYQELLTSAKPDEATLRKYYDEHPQEFEQAKARHILVRFQGSRVPLKPDQKDLTEAEALAKTQELRKRITAGEDFAAVAKAESDDVGSGAQGGDLGSFGRGRMVPVFDQAVFTQPIGEISEPVKSQFGYHLIQVQERTARPFEAVKAELERKYGPEAAKKALDEIKKNTTVVIDEAYFGKQ